MRRLLGLMMVGLLFAGTAAACSSDDDGGGGGDTTETTAADSGGDSGGDSGASAEVEDYCTQAEELGQQLQDAIDDPTSADAAAITQQASELTAAAAELTTTNPDDADRIGECSQLLSVTP